MMPPKNNHGKESQTTVRPRGSIAEFVSTILLRRKSEEEKRAVFNRSAAKLVLDEMINDRLNERAAVEAAREAEVKDAEALARAETDLRVAGEPLAEIILIRNHPSFSPQGEQKSV